MQELYKRLLSQYPIVLLEDPFAEDDWEAWTAFNKECPVELVGDDLLVTNPERVRLANEKKACNSMLLKVNQIGTVTESIEAYVTGETIMRVTIANIVTQCQSGLQLGLERVRVASVRRDHR